MRQRVILASLAALVCVTACRTPVPPVIMRHPDGRTGTCEYRSAARERGCIEDYQRQGYERAANGAAGPKR